MTEQNYVFTAAPRIAVVGVGGAGCNVVSSFHEDCVPVDTIAINTDKIALHETQADRKLYICKEVLHGEGAQGDATVGKRCADIHKEEIREALAGHDAVFVIAGLGGGTGTGAMSVVIDAAQSQNIMTFAVAISPFTFEGRRKNVAIEGWNRIRSVCMNSIIVDNDRVLSIMPELTLAQAFGEVNMSIKAHVLKNIDQLERILTSKPEKPSTTDVEVKDRARDSKYPIQVLLSA